MTPEELLKRYELTPSGNDTLIKYERQLWQARYTPCGRFLIACGYDAAIQRWDLAADEPQLMKSLTGHNGWVQDMDFLPEKQQLLTADSWGQHACWSYSEVESKRVWSLPEAHDGWIRALAVSPDGQTVATGGNGPAVRLWSTEDGKLLKELPHPHRVFSLRFHPDGGSLVSGDLEGVVRQWSLEKSEVVRQMSATVLYNDEAITKGRIQQCGGVRRTLNLMPPAARKPSARRPEGGTRRWFRDRNAVRDRVRLGKRRADSRDADGPGRFFSYDARFHPDGFVMATSSAFLVKDTS